MNSFECNEGLVIIVMFFFVIIFIYMFWRMFYHFFNAETYGENLKKKRIIKNKKDYFFLSIFLLFFVLLLISIGYVIITKPDNTNNILRYERNLLKWNSGQGYYYEHIDFYTCGDIEYVYYENPWNIKIMEFL